MGETDALLSSPPATSTASIPSWLRWTTNASSLLSVFLFSGIVFGWAPLELMLAREGQYGEFCLDEANEGNSQLCPEQIIRLQGVFTVAQFLLNFASLPVGHILDRIPKAAYYGITAACQVVGLGIFAASDSETFDHFLLGYSLMALGGCMTMLGAFPASFLLPHLQLGILASISCLFDASSVVFFIFYRLTLNNQGWARRDLFMILGYIGVAVYVTLAGCWTLLERLNWKDSLQDQSEQHQPHNTTHKTVRNGDTAATPDVSISVPDGGTDGSNHPLRKQPLLKQLLTSEFALIASFASIHILRCNYYIMTADDFLRYLGDSQGFYANIFSFVLPCGVFFVPIIEQTLARLGIEKTLHLTNVLGLVFAALLFVPSLKIQVATFVVFTCFRAYLYSTVNAFIAVHFGVETVGRIVGCTFTAGAVVSLLQYPAAIYSENGDHWHSVNGMLLGICCIPIIQALIYTPSLV